MRSPALPSLNNIKSWKVHPNIHETWHAVGQVSIPVRCHCYQRVIGPGLFTAEKHPSLLTGNHGARHPPLQQTWDGVVEPDCQHGVGDGAVPDHPV